MLIYCNWFSEEVLELVWFIGFFDDGNWVVILVVSLFFVECGICSIVSFFLVWWSEIYNFIWLGFC